MSVLANERAQALASCESEHQQSILSFNTASIPPPVHLSRVRGIEHVGPFHLLSVLPSRAARPEAFIAANLTQYIPRL